MKSGVIYALVDPLSGRVRYVGWTVNLTVRIRDHLKPSRLLGRQRRDRWLNRLVLQGLRPNVVVLEEVAADWAAAERRWIKHYRDAGMDLTNHTDGGEGALGRRHTASAKAAMSLKRKGRKPSKLSIQRTIELRTGKKRSAESVEKGRQKSKGQKRTLEQRARISAAARGRKMHPNTLAAIRSGHAEYYRRRKLGGAPT